jgi:hypothetical protein
VPVKRRTLPDLVIAVADGGVRLSEEHGQARLSVRQRRRNQIQPIEVEQVEDEKDEVGAAPPFRGVLDQRERGDAVRLHPAELAVEIGLPSRYRAQGRDDRRIFAGPVEPGASQHPDIAAIEPGVHAIAIEFELMAPLATAWSFLHELAELRLDPFPKCGIRRGRGQS